VTLSDVARAAGVGESTASRVLRGHGSFSGKTRESVLAAARSLGYVPNRIAGTLASAGSKLVGIVIPSLSNIVFPDLLRGANTVLVAAGYQPVVAVTDYDQGREESVIESLLSWRPAGIMVAGLEHTEVAAARLRSARGRVAEVLDTDGEGIDIVVGYSNREVGRTSARYLVSRGYRRIGYVGHDLSRDLRAAKRFAAFRATICETGLSVVGEEVTPASSSIQAGRDGLARLLERHPELDAVYFSNDDMAIGGYFHCLARGIAIPGSLAIFGYNGLDVARSAPQPLTTILTPRVAVGETGARLVCSDGPPTTVDLGFTLIEGATT
jgi:LacI family gluconate utilization system Gnt-I transcriptional repressor